MKEFVHLHCHSEYSLLDGMMRIDEMIQKTKEYGMKSIALTDHGNIYGAVEFFKKAKSENIKPIIGCEVYIAFEKYWQKRPKIDDKRYHLVLLVKNKKGYQNLVKIITKAHLEGFYYKPRIDDDILKEHSEGLIALSACLQGKIPQLILANKIEEAKKVIKNYVEIFEKENFYLELQPHFKIPEQKKVNDVLIKLSKELKVPLVATNDVHYLNPEDAPIQDILMLINTGSDPNDPERLTMLGEDFSLKPPAQMIEHFKEVPEAIENTIKIAEDCNFEFQFEKQQLPVFEIEKNKTPSEYLKELCLKGLKEKYGENYPQKAKERMDYELEVIEKTGFTPYFLIVQDFVNFAKEKKIAVGPGRGSVGGSLVAYLLGITNIDPLKYNLLFERFLNPERISPPDIDIDFSDERRDEIIDYLSQKYGKECVAQIITFGRMNARAVVRDVGRVLKLPYSFCDKLAKMIPFGMTLSEAMEKNPEFKNAYQEDENARKIIDIAKKLEGLARHASRHACGVVISKEPLDQIVPLQHPAQNDESIVTQFEMHSLEDLGLLKIDILGLKNLTIIEKTIQTIEKNHNLKIDINKIPFDDQKTFQILQRGETIGIFQLESEGMRKWLRELKPTNFEDIVSLLALYRPGPMEWIKEFVDRKHGRKKIEYLHEDLKPILENTYGICIFQEQLMQIAQKLAGFTLGQADTLRKAIGKKIKDLLLKQKEQLEEGMKKRGLSKEIAEKIWNWILPFASYGFNKSHSVAYAIIAFQTAYLKAHFPLEFMASLLNSETNDIEKIAFLINEAKRMKIEVLPPDINESLEYFSVVPEKKCIRFGLLAIKNVGLASTQAIIAERTKNRPFQTIEDFIFRIPPHYINKKTMESLIKVGAFDNLAERNFLLQNLETILEENKKFFREKNSKQITLFDKNQMKPKLKLKSVPPASKKEKLIWEKELLGLFIVSQPFEELKKAIQKSAMLVSDFLFFGSSSPRVKIGGMISSIKKIFSKKGYPVLFLDLYDFSSKIEVIAFPSVFEKKPEIFQENKIVLISGKIENRDGAPKLICDDIEEVIEI